VRCKVFRELMRGLQEFGVCPADGAVASAPGDGDFAGWARIGSEIFEEGLAGHGGFSVAYSWTVWEWWWDTIAGFGSLRCRGTAACEEELNSMIWF